LFQDKRLLDEAIRPKNMDARWDPKPVTDILSNPKEYKEYVSLFGPLELRTDLHTNIEREKKKEKKRNYFENQIERINLWLNHPKLTSWHQKLKKNPTMNFFTLINTQEQTIRHRLKEMNMEMGMLFYGSRSMLIHSSTLESFYFINDNQVITKIQEDKNEVEREVYSIANNCNVTAAFLYFLKSRLWVT